MLLYNTKCLINPAGTSGSADRHTFCPCEAFENRHLVKAGSSWFWGRGHTRFSCAIMGLQVKLKYLILTKDLWCLIHHHELSWDEVWIISMVAESHTDWGLNPVFGRKGNVYLGWTLNHPHVTLQTLPPPYPNNASMSKMLLETTAKLTKKLK